MSPTAQRVALWSALAASAVGALTLGYFGVEALSAPAAPRPAAQRSVVITPAPSSTPSAPQPLVIHGTGDVNLDPRQLGLALTSFAAPWDGVRELFASDDLTVVNLECAPGAGGAPQDKEFRFRCEQGHAQMRAAGVDVANLGNNHSLDYGTEAMLDGRRRLARAGVEPVGAGRDAREANAPAMFEIKGRKVAVLGFGGVVPDRSWIAGTTRPGVADGYSTESMISAVRAADAVADLVVVAIHWGEELDTAPRDDDVARAHALIDAGADAIFGHHAHRVQRLERYKDRPVAYGLGNFVWPRGGPTVIARVVVEPDGAVNACLLPVMIRGGRPAVDGRTACGS